MSIAEKATVISDHNVTIAENVSKVYEAGKQAEYDRFWDNFQNYGNRRNYANAFRGRRSWTDETYNPKYPIIATETIGGVSGADSMMYKTDIRDTKVPITVSGSVGAIFYDTNLMHIRKLIVDENTVFISTSFRQSSLIETLYVEGTIASDINISFLVRLNSEHLLSVINALKDYSADTSGTTHTVTLGDTNIAKLSGEELEKIYAKGWGYA